MTEPEETSFTRVAFPAALGSFVLIGAIDAAYGPLLRPISQRFGESLPAAGTVISVNFAGALTGVLCVLAGFRRAPRRPIAPFALAAVGVGCLTIASARAWQVLNAGVFLTGVGFGATDFSLNQLVARTRARGRAARLTILNAAFGAGAVLAPAIVNALGGRTLSLGFAVAAGGACAMAVGLLSISTAAPGAGLRRGRAHQDAREPSAQCTPELPTLGMLQPPTPDTCRPHARKLATRYAGVAAVALAYLMYVGCESGVAGWIPAHLIALRYSPRFATAVTSAFWGAMTLGRILAVPASRVLPAHRIVLAACPLLMVALALTAVPGIAPACYVAAGFAAAPIFPIGLAWIGTAFSGHRHVTSWALTGSMAGGIAGPAAVAAAVSVAGLDAVPAVLSTLAGAAFVAFLAIWRSGMRSHVEN